MRLLLFRLFNQGSFIIKLNLINAISCITRKVCQWHYVKWDISCLEQEEKQRQCTVYTGPVGYILFARDPKTLYFLPGKNPNRFREKTMSRLLLIGHGIISTCKTAVFGFGLGIITWYKSRCFFSTCKFVTHYVPIFIYVSDLLCVSFFYFFFAVPFLMRAASMKSMVSSISTRAWQKKLEGNQVKLVQS